MVRYSRHLLLPEVGVETPAWGKGVHGRGWEHGTNGRYALGLRMKIEIKLDIQMMPSADEQAVRPRSKAEQAGQDPLVRFAVESLGATIGGVKDHPDPPES